MSVQRRREKYGQQFLGIYFNIKMFLAPIRYARHPKVVYFRQQYGTVIDAVLPRKKDHSNLEVSNTLLPTGFGMFFFIDLYALDSFWSGKLAHVSADLLVPERKWDKSQEFALFASSIPSKSWSVKGEHLNSFKRPSSIVFRSKSQSLDGVMGFPV